MMTALLTSSTAIARAQASQMTLTQQVLTIAVMAAAVMLTRFIPFLVFPSRERTPRFVLFLGKYLGAAVFGMLVVYCLKDVSFLSGNHGWPEMAGILATVGVHLWRRDMMLSMAAGTVTYMLIIQYLI